MEYSLFEIYCMYMNKDRFYDEKLKCTRLIDLKDIADRFKIPIDRSRIKDYKVLDINVRSINNYLKIYDTKLKKEYISEYSYLSNICNISEVFGGIKLSNTVSPELINITITSKESKCEYTYFIDGDVPIIERLSYIDECGNDFYNKLQITKNNEIEFKRGYPSLALPKVECSVDYIKGINCNNFGNSEVVLLNKNHIHFFDNPSNKFFDEVKVYPASNNYSYDRKIINYNNKINYYIKSLYDYNKDNDFCGLCLEDISKESISNGSFYNNLIRYHNRASYCEVSLFNDYKNVKSILFFSQNTDYNFEDSSLNENIIEVFKTDKDIVIRYSVTPEEILRHTYIHDNIYTKDIIIPKQIDNCFNELELDNISRVVAKFSDDKFIKRVLYEIDKFKNLLQFKGNNYYFQDPLSPFLLFNIDISDIEKLISRYPNYYFNVVRHQVDKYINQKSFDSNKVKVLK